MKTSDNKTGHAQSGVAGTKNIKNMNNKTQGKAAETARAKARREHAERAVGVVDAIVRSDSGEYVMTSLKIAEITGKRHADVLRAIRSMETAWEDALGVNFTLVDYTDAKGETRPCYELREDECLYIATKFNDKARAILINEWRQLKNQQPRPQPQIEDYEAMKRRLKAADKLIDAYKKYVSEQEQKLEQENKTINAQKENILDYIDFVGTTLANYDEVISTSQLAHRYGIKATSINRKLADIGVIAMDDDGFYIRKEYRHLGLAERRPYYNRYTDEDGQFLLWTIWGVHLIHMLMAEHKKPDEAIFRLNALRGQLRQFHFID